MTVVKAIHALVTKLKAMSLFAIALWVSLTIHIVILSIHFSPELQKMVSTKPTLDVVLVNAKTKTKPSKADLLAQANLDRGGNTELDKKMKSVLPSIKQQKSDFSVNPTQKVKTGGKAAKKAAVDTKIEQRVAELERQANELMTQMKSTKMVENNPSQASTAKDSQDGEEETPSKLNMADVTAAALEIDKLEAQIAKQHEAYQKRPKRKFLGGRTKEYSFALYEEQVRQKVEKFGRLNYPEAMRNKNIDAAVQFSMSIKADGTVENIIIEKSSGNKTFDEAALNILRMSAPFSEFSPDVRKEADIIVMVRTMKFTREEAFSAE